MVYELPPISRLIGLAFGLLIFGLCMFVKMTKSQDDAAICFMTLTNGNNRKLNRAITNVILSVGTAGIDPARCTGQAIRNRCEKRRARPSTRKPRSTACFVI